MVAVRALELSVGHRRWSQAQQLTDGFRERPQAITEAVQSVIGPSEFSRWSTLKGAPLPKSGPFRAREGGRVDVILVRDPTVYRLTRNMLVPFAIRTGDGHLQFRLPFGALFISALVKHKAFLAGYGALVPIVVASSCTIQHCVVKLQLLAVGGFTRIVDTALLRGVVHLTALAATNCNGVKVVEGTQGHPRDGDVW